MACCFRINQINAHNHACECRKMRITKGVQYFYSTVWGSWWKPEPEKKKTCDMKPQMWTAAYKHKCAWKRNNNNNNMNKCFCCNTSVCEYLMRKYRPTKIYSCWSEEKHKYNEELYATTNIINVAWQHYQYMVHNILVCRYVYVVCTDSQKCDSDKCRDEGSRKDLWIDLKQQSVWLFKRHEKKQQQNHWKYWLRSKRFHYKTVFTWRHFCHSNWVCVGDGTRRKNEGTLLE